MALLSQLIYTSRRDEKCTDQEIDNILAACKKNNANLDITGVLLYSETHFIQYLEGNGKEILGLYDKIKGDDRHHSTAMISFCPIKQRAFPSWQMGAKEVKNSDVEYRTDISPEDKEVFHSILIGNEQEGGKALNLVKKFF